MKILFITHKFYPYAGGIEVNSEILATHFVAFGAEVILATTTIEEADQDFSFEVIRKPSRLRLFSLHKWADVVYENNPTLTLSWPSVLYKKTNVIAVRTWIERVDGTSSYQDKIKKWWLKRADAVIAVSHAIRRKNSPGATVIGNPFRSHIFKRIESIQKTKDFVFLGRLVSDKGSDMAVELIHLLNTKADDPYKYTLTIIGDGEELKNLRELVSQYSLEDQVEFTGILRGKDLVVALNQHKVLLAPSRWQEPFGNIALEGMACGCIPIVSNGGGLPDAVGDAGIVFERNNLNSLYQASLNLLKDKKLQEKYLTQGPIHLKNHLPEVVAQRYYDTILNAFKQRR